MKNLNDSDKCYELFTYVQDKSNRLEKELVTVQFNQCKLKHGMNLIYITKKCGLCILP